MKKTYTLSKLDDVAREIISKSKSNTLLFYGAMGDGKTTLIKALCRALGVKEIVTSPTFSLVNEYTTSRGDRIYHFDFYRMESPEEALDMGFEHYLEDGRWIFIEWPQKINTYLPVNSQKVIINRLSEQERVLEFF